MMPMNVAKHSLYRLCTEDYDTAKEFLEFWEDTWKSMVDWTRGDL